MTKVKGKGWHEDADPVLGKAKRHHEVAVKKEAGEALNKPMERKSESKFPEKEELHIVVDPDKLMKLKEFLDENKIDWKIDEHFDIMEGVAVYIITPEAKAECNALHDFIDKNNIAEGVIEDEPPTTENKSEVVVFQHEKPIPQDILIKFCKEFETGLNENEARSRISINRKDAGDLKGFLRQKGIEIEEVEDEEMEQAHLDTTAEQVVEEVQSKRKPSAVARDNQKTAKQVGRKEDAADLVAWVKNPGKTDLEGVDTEQ